MYYFTLSIFFFLSITPSFSNNSNITLHGDAFLNSNNSSMTLTKENNCTSQPPPEPFLPPSATPPFSIGRAFYVNPIRFILQNATVSSFSCTFTFTIANTPSCPYGDGFAFLITSNTNSSSLYDGYMGLPDHDHDQDFSYFAVEFDTSFDPNLDDINGNHIGVDVDSVKSLASVDVVSRGFDLKNGREMAAWIEYRDPDKMVRVWVWYEKDSRPSSPVLVAQVDLSGKFKEFMHVGFSASNGKGSSVHTVEEWRFKTNSGFNEMSMDAVQEGDCLMCSQEDSDVETLGFLADHPSNRRILTLALVFGSFALVVVLVASILLVICVCFLRRRRRLRRARSERQMRRFSGGRMVPKMLSLTEIRSATNGFNNDKIIGEGASAVVYQGAIPNCGSVAVKRFNHESRFDSSVSQVPFNTEFATMVGCLRHKNLVQLQGWCCEGSELVLVYEYMANGSLDKILHNRTSLTKFLTWERRLNIIRGVANALIYLHEECEGQIIHRDVKTCNILLDAEFNAKLGDFGLAEVYRHSFRTRDATVPAGTMGYLAPEYAFSGVPTVKTDVYSFGVVVLEVCSGRRPVDDERLVITGYVWDLWEKGVITEAADPNLTGRFSKVEMARTLVVGLCCAHPNCDKRPTMRDAGRMLRGESAVPVLPPRKPMVRIQSVLPEGCEEIMGFGGYGPYYGSVSGGGGGGGGGGGETPWSTPRTHFSKY